jgi:hypothetical protein
MNYIFAPYLGVFMDVYLDDIVIYSDSAEDHMKHVKCVLDILRREKLYLSRKKLYFFETELRLLGHIVGDGGVRMDPEKVDDVRKWKTPTNKDLLRTFLGAAGYLANNVPGVRVPMGHLSKMVGDAVPFRWHATEQRAFEEIKDLIQTYRDHHRITLKYGEGQPTINMVTDGCATGVAGLISQGDDWRTAPIAAFYSAKLNSAQQNYAVHEIEMLAGVETMLRHRNILQGASFKWFTDHKALIHLLKQKNLTGRQARWMEKISEFDFEIVYVTGSSNVVADALSRIYSNEEAGTVRARSEYTVHDGDRNNDLDVQEVSMPLLVGLEAAALTLSSVKSQEGESLSAAEPQVALGRGLRTRRPPGDYARLNRDGAQGDGDPQRMTHGVAQGDGDPQRMARGVAQGGGEPQRRTRKVAQRGERPRSIMREHEREGETPEVPEITMAEPEVITVDEVERPVQAAEGRALVDGAKEYIEGIAHDLVEAMTPVAQLQNWMAPGLIEVIADGTPGFDLPFCLKDRYKEDPFFGEILDAPKEFKNFEVDRGLIFLKAGDKRLLCIPRIIVGGRNAQEVIISHAHSMLAHLGAHKTVTYLRDHVWWKQLANDVQKYCDSCIVCRKSKPNNQKPYGLLNPLPVPVRPWEAIGIDFVGPLPSSKNRDGEFDTITVIIDLLTAMVHLVPSRQDFRAKDVAELVFDHVYKLHGLPKAIVSDRDSLFTSAFWKHLHGLMGVELKMSSAYHPETDGSTERANRTVTQMLRQCVQPDQKDWVTKLPAIEFAINSARSESTGYAPFFLNTGRMPRSMIWDSAGPDEYPGVRVYAQRMKDAVMAAHDSIIAARVKQVRAANRRRRPAPFAVGDLVYISSKDLRIPKGRARKLVPKYVGPYKIVKTFSNDSFAVELPPELKQRGIHGSFHSSKLRIHVPNDDRLFPGRLLNQVADFPDRGKEWAVERIASHKGKGKNAVFEVVWKSGDRTWLPYDEIAHLNALNGYLEALGIESVSGLKGGSGKPPGDDAQVFVGTLDPGSRAKATYKKAKVGVRDSKMARIHVEDKTDFLQYHPFFRFIGDYYIAHSPEDWQIVKYSKSEVDKLLDVPLKIRLADGVRPILPDRYIEFAGIYNQWENNDKLVGLDNVLVPTPLPCNAEAEEMRRMGKAFGEGDPMPVPIPEPGELAGEEGDVGGSGSSVLVQDKARKKGGRKARKESGERPYTRNAREALWDTDEGRKKLLNDSGGALLAQMVRKEAAIQRVMEARKARRGNTVAKRGKEGGGGGRYGKDSNVGEASGSGWQAQEDRMEE